MELELRNRDFAFLSKNGSFFILSLKRYSRFFGLFFPYNKRYIKIFDHLKNLNIVEKPEKIILDGSDTLKIFYKDNYEIYKLFKFGLLYETKKISKIQIFFDIKDIYDTEEWGRIYNYQITSNMANIEFKKNDLFVRVYLTGFSSIFENKDKWVEIYYDFDEKRNSPPFKRYLYCPFTIKGKKLIISLIRNPKIKDYYKKESKNLIEERIKSFIHDWISVGYPWYYQEWSRDVLISLKGLYYILGKSFVKEKLIEYSKYILPNGKMKNLIFDGLNGNSDSFGLYAKRIFDFEYIFSKEEFLKLVNIVEDNLPKFTETHYDPKTKLFVSFPNESWMDTLNRKYPIELQFLVMNIYENLYRIKRDERYRDLYLDLKDNVEKRYLKDNSLVDTFEEYRIRPNVFLCYYIKKDVLSKEKWEKIFDYSLNHLWLEWGGLSSLSKLDYEFIEENNGDANFIDSKKSMHRGDSWIYLNHIAAICMNDLNSEKYKYYINKILNSSIEYLKDIGTLPELSSAKNRDISGAISQLWSLSTFVELLKNLKISWNKIEEYLK
ncbi:MAG: amylo-alpha-1,6-glucosidase [Nanopusillaceae archaeon]